MPFSRITLLRGKSPAYLQALSDSLHSALVDTFLVPPTDRFQAIHQLERHELIFDRDYLAGPRSDDFVVITIALGKPRDTATKQAFFAALVERLARAPGIRPEDVMVVLSTSTRDEWSLGNGKTQMLEELR